MKNIILRIICILEVFRHGKPHRHELLYDEERNSALVCSRCKDVRDIEFYEETVLSTPEGQPIRPPQVDHPSTHWNSVLGDVTPPRRQVVSVRNELEELSYLVS